MTAEEHNKTLATLWLIYGAMHSLTLVGLLLLVLIFKFASIAGNLITGTWLAIGALLFVLLMLAVGLLPLWIGYGFRRRRRSTKPLAIAVALISLINIPIGTALGIYTIKFLRSEGGIGLYGGQARATSEEELQGALKGARPLMNLAERLK